MIIAYEYRRTTTRSALNRKQSEKPNKIDHGSQIDKHIVYALDEQEKIEDVYKKLCKYLQIHCTIPINDAIPKYMEYFVSEEETKYKTGADNDAVLEVFKVLQRNSENEINLLTATLRNERHSANQTELIDAGNIFPLIATLYDLPIHGERIRMQAEELKHKPNKIKEREIFVQLPAKADSSTLMLEFKRCMSKLS